MSFTTPIYIPLVEGLDLSKDANLGQKELHAAENIDFSVQGEVRGRPSRVKFDSFIVRNPSGSPTAPTYQSPVTFANTGLTSVGLMRLRDGSGERPLLGTQGVLFGLEDDGWRERGAFACMKVDRSQALYSYSDPTQLKRLFTGPDFNSTATGNLWTDVQLTDPDTGSFTNHTVLGTGAGPDAAGGAARCGTVTAAVYRTFGGQLRIVLRNNGASTISDVLLATDAATCGHDGDDPAICCDYDQTSFFVAYQTTVANQYKVLKVTTAGAVSATFTSTLTGIRAHWVANSTVADNIVVIALTNADGLTLKTLNATTMADNAKDSTYGSVNVDAKECVVGVESATRAWWCVRVADNMGGGLVLAATHIGTSNPSTAATAAVAKSYLSNSPAFGVQYYTPIHQPVKFGGRMYMALGGYTQFSTSAGLGTWFVLDLSNMDIGSAGAYSNPTLVARGPLDATAFIGSAADTGRQPSSAVLLADSSGWAFQGIEWTSFGTNVSSSLTGLSAVAVRYAVRTSKPRAVLAGGATLFSGSVMRTLASDQCYEAGHPAGRPVAQLNPLVGGGALTAGSYTIYACWAYVDGDGQVNRSNVVGLTQSVAGPADRIEVYVQNPYWSERTNRDLFIEVYSTTVNPTADTIPTLQSSTAYSTTNGYTKVTLSSIATGTTPLYTASGEFQHITPNADGGIAAMGRRVWVADRNTVYASLLLQPRQGATWNDEGSLSVSLPAGAGRILALESMEDKLAVFAERGVWMIQDGGPDNTGLGADISYPIRVSDLGVAGPRSTCATDRGVVFCAPLDATDPERGGPWLLDRSMTLTDRKFLGSPARSYFQASWTPEVAFSPERQQVYITVPTADFNSNSGVVVIDFRQSKWSTWAHLAATGTIQSVECVSGILWSLGTAPGSFSGEPVSDNEGNYVMRLLTSHYPGNGQDGLGWSRVRSASVLGVETGGSYTLSMYATQDQSAQYGPATFAMTAPGLYTPWPRTRGAPEWRLPNQKCSTIQLDIRADNGSARWAAIRLDVQPLPGRAPALQRT